MVLQAFIDDSKTGDSRAANGVFVLAGYVAGVADWLNFTSEWQEVLDMRPAMSRFKMSKIYGEMGRANAVTRLKAFRNVIERHARGAVSASVDLDVYKKYADRKRSGGLPANPYYVLLLDMAIQLKRSAPLIGLNEKIEFIFDEQMSEKKHVKYAWENIVKTRPDIAAFLGNEPKWEREEDFLALQAADKLAWWTRRHREETLLGKPLTPFPWETSRNIPQIVLDLDEDAILNIINGPARS